MTELTVTVRWPHLIMAIFLGPAFVSIGLIAISLLIPAAYAAGVPYIAEPEMTEFGHRFAPAWCVEEAPS